MENARIIYIARAFANDLDYMRAHVVGMNFEHMQSIAWELESELLAEIEDLTPFIITHGAEIDNISNLKSHIDFGTEWEALTNQIIDEESFVSELFLRGMAYIKELEGASIPKELKDMYIKFWKKHIIYDNGRRGMMISIDTQHLGD